MISHWGGRHQTSSSRFGEDFLATFVSAMAGRFDDDDYVANLLKQDAKKANKSYELVGIDAFNPRRCLTVSPCARHILTCFEVQLSRTQAKHQLPATHHTPNR